MRVVLAGASGAIGRLLVPRLIAAKHEVIGITRTPGSLASTGAREVVADVLHRDALLEALAGIKADAVIHQLTALRKAPSSMRDMRDTNRLRAEGTSTLIAAARLVGATKFVAASFFGGYGLTDHGRTPLTEDAPFGDVDGRSPILYFLRPAQPRAAGARVRRCQSPIRTVLRHDARSRSHRCRDPGTACSRCSTSRMLLPQPFSR